MRTKEQKTQMIEKLGQLLGEAPGLAISAYTGLTMKELNELRDSIRPLGGKFMVVKNTLTGLAAKGTPYEAFLTNLDGPIALLFMSEEGTAILKSLFSFSKSHKALQLQSGYIDGSLLDEAALKAYSELPTKDEVRSMFLGVLAAPMTQMAGVLDAPARTLVGVLNAYEEKIGEEKAA